MSDINNEEILPKKWKMYRRAVNGTSLGSLPVGSLVKDINSTFLGVPVVWKIADVNHEGYPSNSVTLITDKAIAHRAFDAKESGGDSARVNYGNNRYSLSNIRQWLNSDAEAGQWYTSQHTYDTAPSTNRVYNSKYYDTKPGFLNSFSDTFKNSLLDTPVIVSICDKDGGGFETVTDKIFLASMAEVGIQKDSMNRNEVVEGSILPIFSDKDSRLVYDTLEAREDMGYSTDAPVRCSWYLRTPWLATTYAACYVGSGNLSNGRCWQSLGILPLCNISSSTLVSTKPDSDGCYRILF